MIQTFRNKKIIYRRGYPAICDRKHHKAGKNGLVEIHYIIAEEILGRPLEPEEVVHHIDENRENYDKENLMIFDNTGSHTCYHQCKRNNLNMKLTRINNVWHCESLDNVHHLGKYQNTNMWICPVCFGPMKSKYATKCEACYLKQKAKNIPSKNELLSELQHFKSFKELGRKYGVSDIAIRKWCKKYELPYHAKDYKKHMAP